MQPLPATAEWLAQAGAEVEILRRELAAVDQAEQSPENGQKLDASTAYRIYASVASSTR